MDFSKAHVIQSYLKLVSLTWINFSNYIQGVLQTSHLLQTKGYAAHCVYKYLQSGGVKKNVWDFEKIQKGGSFCVRDLPMKIQSPSLKGGTELEVLKVRSHLRGKRFFVTFGECHLHGTSVIPEKMSFKFLHH